MNSFFSNIDEIEATIYQTKPEELENLAQVNVEIYNFVNSKKVLKTLSNIYQLEREPQTFGEFMAWIKCRNHAPIECINHAMEKGYVNLFLYFYVDNKSWQERSSSSWDPYIWTDMTIWLLEQRNSQLLEVALEPYEGLTDTKKIRKLASVIYQLAEKNNSLALLITLLNFYSLDITNYEILKKYINGIVGMSENKLLDLTILENYLNENGVLDADFYNFVADAASKKGLTDILIWSLNKGANNYYEIFGNLLVYEDYKIIYQLLSRYGGSIKTDVIDLILNVLFGHTPTSAWESFSDSNVDLNLLLRYIKEKWPETYQELLINYRSEEESKGDSQTESQDNSEDYREDNSEDNSEDDSEDNREGDSEDNREDDSKDDSEDDSEDYSEDDSEDEN
jgi:hypothetical protein